MSETPLLGLPLIAAAQAQKHVTHNEALGRLDALVHCAVLDKDLSGPPASPPADARHIVGPSPTGVWAGRAGAIAAWQDGAWEYIEPRTGFLVYVADEKLLYIFRGEAWSPLTEALASIQNLGRLGVGTAADDANPFSAKLNAALWTARPAGEGGTGDLRYTLNKEGAGDVLSLLFQSGYSGRFELGLVGSDNPVLKVSPNGADWRTALKISAATGGVDSLSDEGTVASAATIDLGAVPHRRVAITGTATVGSFGPAFHVERMVRFTDALTLLHDPISLVLPGGASILTGAGDTAVACSDHLGRWRVVAYQRAGGKALVPTTKADLQLSANDVPVFYGVSFGYAPGSAQLIYNGGGGDLILRSGSDLSTGYFVFRSTGTMELLNGGIVTAGPVTHNVDNGYAFGSPALRATALYAATGAIQTSDARLKTAVTPLDAAEIAASRELGAAIGTFQFLDAVARKGEVGARRHAGLTVQRAAAIMRSHGLDPWRYAWLCHDSWDEIPSRPDAASEPGEDGRPVEPVPGSPGFAAGDRYAFRPDQLALFIARGHEARLAELEARLDG